MLNKEIVRITCFRDEVNHHHIAIARFSDGSDEMIDEMAIDPATGELMMMHLHYMNGDVKLHPTENEEMRMHIFKNGTQYVKEKRKDLTKMTYIYKPKKETDYLTGILMGMFFFIASFYIVWFDILCHMNTDRFHQLMNCIKPQVTP